LPKLEGRERTVMMLRQATANPPNNALTCTPSNQESKVDGGMLACERHSVSRKSLPRLRTSSKERTAGPSFEILDPDSIED
jgi:hypothetical protein